MINETKIVDDRCDAFYKYHRKCLSWSAILAGAIVGFSISFLLNLFGIAIGLAAFTNTPQGVHAFAIGGFIGLIIAAIVSMFVAGMVSGFLGRRYCVRRNLGILYGFLAFGLALFFAVLMTAPLTKFVTLYNAGLYGYSNVTAVIANPNGVSSTVVTPQSATTNGPALNDTNSAAAASTEQNVNDLGKTALLTFLLFAVGALSACIGGHCGMCCKCKDEDVEVVTRETVVKS